MTHDGEVPAVELEAELVLEHAEERAQLRDRHLLDPFAALAEQVLVGLVREVVDGPPVTEVDMVDDPQLLERLERSVHGREVHRREAGLHRGRDLLRGEVAPSPDDRFDDGLTARRPASGPPATWAPR